MTKKNDDCVQALQKFILDVSIRDLNIGMRALHLFQAWSEDDKASYQDRALAFYEMVEGTLVNLKLPRTFQDKSGGLQYQQNLHDLSQYKDKLFKADYISLRLKFM